jgi:phage terminase large subunit GpA-like protein
MFVVDMIPGPMMVVQPTLELGKRWSKQRLTPSIEESPHMKGKMRDSRDRESGNTLMTKEFDGGILIITGANSAAGLRSMPVMYLFLDEVDAYPPDVEDEGDPIALAEKRTANFPRRKTFECSTPTVADFSRIEADFLETDMQYYHVPCPFCKKKQILRWANIKWQRTELDDPRDKYKLIRKTASYQCEHCNELIPEHYKTWMLDEGNGAEWIATNPDADPTVAGFHINALYAPIGWRSWAEIIIEFLRAKNDPVKLKTWVNTILAETWQEGGITIDDGTLSGRRENYVVKNEDGTFSAIIPAKAAFLTAGVDTQDDRLVYEVVAWGKGWESWSLDCGTFYGDPADRGPNSVWMKLHAHLTKTWEHELGAKLLIIANGVDTGGHYTQEAYEFVAPRQMSGFFAFKGSNDATAPLVSKPVNSKVEKVKLFYIGTHTAKQQLFSRLRMTRPGPGYLHFSQHNDEDYFKQLTAEKPQKKYKKGTRMPHIIWVKLRERNEFLDCRILATAAMLMTGIDLDGDSVDRALKSIIETSHRVRKPGMTRTRVISQGVEE